MSDKEHKAVIGSLIDDFPICEYFYLSPKDLIFSDKVRYICRHDCPRYGRSWACPPAIWPVEQAIGECFSYDCVFLFTTVAEETDTADLTACLKARREHELLTLELKKRFEEQFGKVLALSTGCMLCEECAYPDAPCRHPDQRLSAIESHGILVMETASRLGVTLDYGGNTVTYLSLIFFNRLGRRQRLS